MKSLELALAFTLALAAPCVAVEPGGSRRQPAPRSRTSCRPRPSPA